MEWSQHAPTEEGIYWIREFLFEEDSQEFYNNIKVCRVIFTEYRGEELVELLYLGNDRESEHHDRNWYYGPIEPPTFDKE